MDYYKTFTTFLPKESQHIPFFINRFQYIMENMYNFIQCDELPITNSLVYTFEHNYKAIIIILSYFIKPEDRKNLWIYSWENDDFRNQLYNILDTLNQKHLILWFFLHCNYINYPQYDEEKTKLISNMHFLENKELKFDNINNLYNNLFGRNLLPFFSLSYRSVNNSDLFVRRSKFYKHICPDLEYNKLEDRQVRKVGKIKIGFISDFLVIDSSVLRDRMGIIKNLSREEYEIYILVHCKPENINKKISKNMYELLIDEYVHLPSNLNDSREKINDLELDILVYCEIGMSVKNFILAHSRLAPVQLTTWGHSDTSGIETLDYYISSKYFEIGAESQSHYSEKLIIMDSFGCHYYKPSNLIWDEEYKILDRENYNIDEDVIVYGCIQSSFKISEEFEDILVKILENTENSKIILSNNVPFTKSQILRIKEKMGENYNRISLYPNLEPNSYLNLISLCDITLDPYPFGGCNTSFESFEFGIPVITLPTKYINGRFTYGLYKKMGIMDMVAKNKDEYLKLCIDLYENKEKLNTIKTKIKSKNELLFEEQASIDEWNDLFKSFR